MKDTQQILVATINCIEKYGINSVTTRRIAKIAGVNPSAINYYYKSKGVLINKALNLTLKHYFDDLNKFATMDVNNHENFVEGVFTYMIEGVATYPNITLAHLYKPIFEKKRNSTYIVQINNVMEIISKKIAKFYPEKNPKKVIFFFSQFMYQIISWAIVPGIFDRFVKWDFKDKKFQNFFKKFLLEEFNKI